MIYRLFFLMTLVLLYISFAPEAAPSQESMSSKFTKNPNLVKAGRYRLDPIYSKITWSVDHMGFSTFYGHFTQLTGDLIIDPRNIEKTLLTVKIDTNSIDALNSEINDRLKGSMFLDTSKYPECTFVSGSLESTSLTTARISGTLTLRGVSRQVTFDATFNQAGINPSDEIYSVGFDGWTVIKRSEFGINQSLPLLGDEVRLRLAGEFKLQ